MSSPIATGPLSKEEFATLIDLPFGGAAKRIRRYDPLWGRAPGEKIEWKVECSGQMSGTAYIKAASKEDAEKVADALTSSEVDWGDDDFTIDSIEAVQK